MDVSAGWARGSVGRVLVEVLIVFAFFVRRRCARIFVRRLFSSSCAAFVIIWREYCRRRSLSIRVFIASRFWRFIGLSCIFVSVFVVILIIFL